MLLRIGIAIGAVLILFLGFVAMKPGKFRYERSGVIRAPAEKIYPYLVDYRKGGEWSPYEKMDPNMKKTYTGPEGAVGSKFLFEAKKDVGSGHLELLAAEPNKSATHRLTMTEPFHGENLIDYTLTPEAEGTRFTWAMSGEFNFMFKLMGVFMDCEKMITDQFTEGIANLKAVVEGA